jgi:4-hydroxy-tetrahydrodipicolinate reductase
MKITLIGYGKMGREIEKAALERGHEIVRTIDVDNPEAFDSPAFLSTDVAIEFTRPESAYANYLKCFERHIPVVAGTTGWTQHLDAVRKACCEQGQTFFYASNYSVGVNLFFALNRRLAQLMNRFTAYDVRMEEIHHIHKLDAPSGTALTLAEDIVAQIDRKTRDQLTIESKRTGEVPGIHEVIYESEADSIRIRHEAFNRRGFAVGAVMAAEFICGRTGFFTMNDLLKL